MSAGFTLNDVLGIPKSISTENNKCLYRFGGSKMEKAEKSKFDFCCENALIL